MRLHPLQNRSELKIAGNMANDHGLTQISTFVGKDTEIPPELRGSSAAKLVIALWWSWSPAHSRASEYRIAADRHRCVWKLYESISELEEDERRFLCVATGQSRRGISAKHAALQLLRASWQTEIGLLEFDPAGAKVDKCGLLNKKDYAFLAADLEWINSTSFLARQSDQSLLVLRKSLPIPLDKQSLKAVTEIEYHADAMKLPVEFLALCLHYNLESLHLETVARLLRKDATALIRRRSRDVAARVKLHKLAIESLVEDLSDERSTTRWVPMPSLRDRVAKFLTKYVGEHGKLPSGKHRVHATFGPDVDFDSLRKRHGF